MTENALDLMSCTAEIVASFVGHNMMRPEELPRLVASVYGALRDAAQPEPIKAEPAPPVPAVPVGKSITPDYMICLDDGRRFKSLKRHLAQLGMTPSEYRAKWGLPADYPMTAPAYAARRSQLAKEAGLGRRAA